MAGFTAALVQANPVMGDVKGNLATVVDAVRGADADLVVFPELFLSGYAMRDFLKQCAVAPDGPVMDDLAAACRETGRHVIVGAPTPGVARGTLHNSALLVGPDGFLGKFDKAYLPTFSVFEEDLYFKEGASLPVFDTPLGRIGMCICYDLFFPEVTKAMALAGADALVCISASPTISRKYFEAVFPARAIETTTWLLYTNLTGPQDAASFWGGAQAWGPRGDLKTEDVVYDEPHTTTVRVDYAELEEARAKRPALRDTRPEVLRRLWQAGGGA